MRSAIINQRFLQVFLLLFASPICGAAANTASPLRCRSRRRRRWRRLRYAQRAALLPLRGNTRGFNFAPIDRRNISGNQPICIMSRSAIPMPMRRPAAMHAVRFAALRPARFSMPACCDAHCSDCRAGQCFDNLFTFKSVFAICCLLISLDFRSDGLRVWERMT